MAGFVYLLCALTALACAWLLLRSYRRGHNRLLLWSGLCFSGMFINNVLLMLDLLAFPDIDLSLPRQLCALLALMPLLYGLIWEDQ